MDKKKLIIIGIIVVIVAAFAWAGMTGRATNPDIMQEMAKDSKAG